MRTFFGLPNIKNNRELTEEETRIIVNSKKNLYKEIWDLSYYSQGAINWKTIYEMPTWLRRLNIKFLNDARKEEGKANKQSNKKSQVMKSPNIRKK